MPSDRLDQTLAEHTANLERTGTAKGAESVTVAVIPATAEQGPRYLLEGEGDRPFLRMNSNGYLGMALRREVIEAEEKAAKAFGAGPQAVRFISGTYQSHTELETRLASFHGREAAMVFSSAYATVMGTLTPLISQQTAVISDQLNHNCIINAVRLSRPAERSIYPHNDLDALTGALEQVSTECSRVLVITDGVFSMRGDYAPLAEILAVVKEHDARFADNVVVVVDDSHGVGAFGKTGRGTEEVCGARGDILIGTLGKAFGVNGGYVVGSRSLVQFLRETAPFYIYSNPITPGEAAAAKVAIDILDSAEGRDLLRHLSEMTARFEQGLVHLGYETIPGPHPVVPLMVRDTSKTAALVEHLYQHQVLATGLNYPVVPKGDEEIRFQVSADHTQSDIDGVLEVLASFPLRQD